MILFEPSLDHKLGIHQPDTPLILGESVPSQFVKDYFDNPQSPFFETKPKEIIHLQHKFKNYDDENKEIVSTASEILRRDTGLDISERSIERAFDKKRIPCRFEKVPQNLKNGYSKEIILDVGHNLQALKRTLDRI